MVASVSWARLGRRWRPRLMLGVVAVALAAAGIVALAAGAMLRGTSPGLSQSITDVRVAGDGDGDGLADAVENRIGSNRSRPDTLGKGVADGWLHYWFGADIDWSNPSQLDRPALVPPADLLPKPLQTPGSLTLPTIAELFHSETTRARAAGFSGAWWLAFRGLHPQDWDHNGDGIADAWLLTFGLNPAESANSTSPGDPAMELREKYVHGLSPLTSDTDADGLLDTEELEGLARLDVVHRFKPTDPRQPSTRDDAILDGYLVRLDLDPHDRDVGSATFLPGGFQVSEAFAATLHHCRSRTGSCDWRARLLAGPVADARQVDANADGVPDAWVAHDPNRAADPLDDARTIVIDDTGAWDRTPWPGCCGSPPGLVIDNLNPSPRQPGQLTIAQAYAFNRPANWHEATQGPWLGGLPTRSNQSEDRLPPSVGHRGWFIQVNLGLGPLPQNRTIWVNADPRSLDSDSDGVPTLWEYLGLNRTGQPGKRTNPSSPDTDGDGLRDGIEDDLGTDPTALDTAGAFLEDGDAFDYWQARFRAALRAFELDSGKALEDYAWLRRPGEDPLAAVGRLRPLGTLTPGSAGTSPNLLAPDPDADGIPTGAELYPNQFLGKPSSHWRPATDPARIDSDGDGLPDSWEVRWSEDRYFGCRGGCRSSVAVPGWPIDPSKRKSVEEPDATTDFEINLSGDVLLRVGAAPKYFSNGLAFKFDLNPFSPDSDGDGIPNSFAIWWGVDHVPPDVQAVALGQPEFAWAVQAREQISTGLVRRGFPPLNSPVIIDPGQKGSVTPESNLLEMFRGQEKGTWKLQDGRCTPERRSVLPSVGPRLEVAPRAGLSGCWSWVSYPLRMDIERGTNPWSLDSDSDGLPDAWAAAYGVAPGLAHSDTAGSLAASCQDVKLRAGLPLPPGGRYCVTYLDAYRLGIDPRRQDSDGGGLPDWIEIALATDPRIPDDDFPHEDWDGDQLTNIREIQLGTNPMLPDTDNDGLADGGNLDPAFGNGDICIAPGSTTVSTTRNRPGGPFNGSELVRHFIQSGVLHDRATCPPGHIRFKSEGIYDPQAGFIKGSGGGTDPLRPSTSRTGIPDGWFVYWRDRSNHPERYRLFDPLKPNSGAGDLDNDFVSNLGEYLSGRPADWDDAGTVTSRARDGPWWGGLDPTVADTNGNRNWLRQPLGGDDDQDLVEGASDEDCDGLYSEDPYSADPWNEGIVTRDETGNRYITDFDALWRRLDARRQGCNADSDMDGVPNWLDRARVRISNLHVALPDGGMEKNDWFLMEGHLRTDEPPQSVESDRRPPHLQLAPHGSPVTGATIRAVVMDSTGNSSLVALGFTNEDGRFSLNASLSGIVTAATLPEGGAVASARYWPPGTIPSVASPALRLRPGPVQLFVQAEANDPTLQPLSFGAGRTLAEAFKTRPFWLIDGREVAEFTLRSDGAGPSVGGPTISHASGAIFASPRVSSTHLLRAQAVLTIQLPQEPVLGGTLALIRGRLTDLDGSALPHQQIIVALPAAGFQTSIATGSDGGFLQPVPTTGLPVGNALVRIRAAISDDHPYLTAPPEFVGNLPITEEVSLKGLRINSQGPLDLGSLVTVPADQAVRIQGQLRDHHDNPATLRPWSVRLEALGPRMMAEAQGQADHEGRVDATLTLNPAALPLEDLTLRIESANVRNTTIAFVRPKLATNVRLAPTTVDVQEEGKIFGELLRSNGVPLAHLQDASFIVSSSRGDIFVHNGTGPLGRFGFPVQSIAPANLTWNVTFVGTPRFMPAPPAFTHSLHIGQPQLALKDVTALRDQPVIVPIRAYLSDGHPASGKVRVGWKDESARFNMSLGGSGLIKLPPRVVAGSYGVVASLEPTSTTRAAHGEAVVRVLVPTVINLTSNLTRIPASGTSVEVAHGVLHDSKGALLAGRTIQYALTAGSFPGQEGEVVTDAGGRFRILKNITDLDAAGPWELVSRYAGSALEAPSMANMTLEVEHAGRIMIERAPPLLRSSQQFEVAGLIQAAGPDLGSVVIRIEIAGREIARKEVAIGDLWVIQARLPSLPSGAATIRVAAEPRQNLDIRPAHAQVTIVSNVVAVLVDTITQEGTHEVEVTLLQDGAPRGDLEVVIVQLDDGGQVVDQRIARTDSQGKLTVNFAPRTGSQVAVAALRSAEAEMGTVQLQQVLLEPQSQGAKWAWGGILLILASIALGMWYALWRRRQHMLLSSSLASAWANLNDPETPVALAIQKLYDRLLRVLVAEGYPLSETQTPRDICATAGRIYSLPETPLHNLTSLFEFARYSALALGPEQRAIAMDALKQLQNAIRRDRGSSP